MKDKDFDDFENEFLNSDSSIDSPVNSSDAIQNSILQTKSMISEKLNPSWGKLSKKLAMVHLLSSLVTLSLCNQMGVRLFFDGPGLMDVFMVFGFWACMSLCGAFYMGASFFALAFVVDLDERNKFQKRIPVLVGLLSVVSLGALFLGGASVSLGVAIVWLIGAELAGVLSFKLASRLKSQIAMS